MRMRRVLAEKVSERKYKRKWTAVGRKNILEGFGLRETKEREKLCVELLYDTEQLDPDVVSDSTNSSLTSEKRISFCNR
jgi:hypothetical protein